MYFNNILYVVEIGKNYTHFSNKNYINYLKRKKSLLKLIQLKTYITKIKKTKHLPFLSHTLES